MIKIAVAVTGASGSIYAKVLLEQLQRLKDQVAEVGVVWSDNAFTVWEHELGNKDHEKVPFKVWNKNDFMAPFASGSSSYQALIICPCSMGTLGRIAGGISNDRNMTTVTEAGGIICPATPSFYSSPKTFDDVAYTVIHRVLQLAGLNAEGYRWGG